MSKIVRIIDVMDRQLATAQEYRRQPQYFILREEEWEEIGERFKGADGDTPPIVGNTYKGVPVRFGTLNEDDMAIFVDRE